MNWHTTEDLDPPRGSRVVAYFEHGMVAILWHFGHPLKPWSSEQNGSGIHYREPLYWAFLEVPRS